MRIHILGICGTFMAGIAQLAVELGHEVSGSDRQFAPPMSRLLECAGVRLYTGYDPEHLAPEIDLVLMGNVVMRGNPELEAAIDQGFSFDSGPAWLFREVLKSRRVIAVAGTHGKTTTTALLAHLMDQAGADPGFLIGGVPHNFPVSARLGQGRWFVIEADEYDTAFFDKRPKFLHYRPWILVLNNLEHDHADLYPDLASLEQVFHELVRAVPRAGRIVVNGQDQALSRVLERGLYTPLTRVLGGAEAWLAESLDPAGNRFRMDLAGRTLGPVTWGLSGEHNLANVLAALGAAEAAGVDPLRLGPALASFGGVARRLEIVATGRGITVYDDFAHHPTAIRATLGALRAGIGTDRVVAVFEPRSNSMKQGVHAARLKDAFRDADVTVVFNPGLTWKVEDAFDSHAQILDRADRILPALISILHPGDRVVFLSNGDFSGERERIYNGLRQHLLD
ncbi:MAG: UDP-N-acetylmuramate:L-alanyl-gamma-D-glutamyl-meso-diaminopimelate ligase [Gammaproteobacteria bacterium]